MDTQPRPAAPVLARLRRWADRLGARGTRRAFFALAVAMALVLLASYTEVLQDQVARASVTDPGAPKPVAEPDSARADARADPSYTR